MAGAVLALSLTPIPTAATAGSWSPPSQLSTDFAAGPSVAVNASGAEVAAGYAQVGSTFFVYVSSSTDGRTWSPASTLGEGVSPAVALAPDGRAVVAWEGLQPAGGIQASVRPPGRSWSTAVTVGTDVSTNGGPVIGIDQSGNAIAAWVAWGVQSGGIKTASLPAGGTWTREKTLATGTGWPQAPNLHLAVNSAGAAIVTWAGPKLAILADSGTVLGGFATPVTVAPAAYGHAGHPRVALNDADQASLIWSAAQKNLVATRVADGTWSAPTQLTANGANYPDTAIDGAGDAIAVFEPINQVGTSTKAPLYASRHPAGGTWGAPARLSSLNDSVFSRVASDGAGTFVVAWSSSSTGTLNAFTSAPGSGFGPTAEVVGNSGAFDLKIASGHAVLMWIPPSGAAVSTEPVS